MKAIIEDGRVTTLVTGDVDCGISLPTGSPVATGWGYADDTFTPPLGLTENKQQKSASEVERHWRSAVLGDSDWFVSRHREELDAGRQTSLSLKQFSKLLSYRQALRDWPGSTDSPDAELRPQPPKWLAKQVTQAL